MCVCVCVCVCVPPFRADSMTWNPHKMMGVPLQCSAILCRHKVSAVRWSHVENSETILFSLVVRQGTVGRLGEGFPLFWYVFPAFVSECGTSDAEGKASFPHPLLTIQGYLMFSFFMPAVGQNIAFMRRLLSAWFVLCPCVKRWIVFDLVLYSSCLKQKYCSILVEELVANGFDEL